MIEWLAIPAGVVSGAVSGFAAAWVGRPAAAAAAEEAKARSAERRKLVGDGRALVQEAHAANWTDATVAGDERFIRLRRHLAGDVAAPYQVPSGLPQTRISISQVMGMRHLHEPLQRDIERLDREWKLS